MELKKNTVLLIIDVQKAFKHPKWGIRNNPNAERNIEKLIKIWRETDRSIIYVQHISNNESSLFNIERETSHFMDFIQPLKNEVIIQKQTNSSFIGTNLEEILGQLNCKNLIIVGLTTNHCVETTTRMAGNLGYNTVLVSDATATYERKGVDGKIYPAELIHQISLANMHHEFAEIIDTQTIIKKLI